MDILPLFTHTQWTSSYTCSHMRWWTIPSLVVEGISIWYNDPIRRNNTSTTIRESFWMRPVAGSISQEAQHTLSMQQPQHGFLRDVVWHIKKSPNSIYMEYIHTQWSAHFAWFPYQCTLQQYITIEKNIATCALHIINNDIQNIPYALWHHTYYSISQQQKKHITTSLDLTPNEFDDWIEWRRTIVVQNPIHISIQLPSMPAYTLYIPPTFRYIWLWSEPQKDFVCIEPVTANPESILHEYMSIPPDTTQKVWFSISLE